jgi:prevent-host-death family protein
MKVTTKPKQKKPRTMRGQLGAAEFKARCLELMDEVHRTGIPLTVTKRGKPVVRVVRAMDDGRPLFGAGKGMVLYMGDIISPTGEEWEAER